MKNKKIVRNAPLRLISFLLAMVISMSLFSPSAFASEAFNKNELYNQDGILIKDEDITMFGDWPLYCVVTKEKKEYWYMLPRGEIQVWYQETCYTLQEAYDLRIINEGILQHLKTIPEIGELKTYYHPTVPDVINLRLLILKGDYTFEQFVRNNFCKDDILDVCDVIEMRSAILYW